MAKLNFDQFHPLDHRPGDARCRAHFGGWKHHLRLAWDYHRKDQVLRPLRRSLFCKLRQHRWEVWYSNNRDGQPSKVHPVCKDCQATRLPSEHEVDTEPRWPTFE